MQLNDAGLEIQGHVVAFTDRGVLVSISQVGDSASASGMEEWLPKSVLEVDMDTDLDHLEKGQYIAFRLPTWIALERGIFDD